MFILIFLMSASGKINIILLICVYVRVLVCMHVYSTALSRRESLIKLLVVSVVVNMLLLGGMIVNHGLLWQTAMIPLLPHQDDPLLCLFTSLSSDKRKMTVGSQLHYDL